MVNVAVLRDAGPPPPCPDDAEPYFITHAPVSGSYKGALPGRRPARPAAPVVFSLHHALLAVQG